MDAIAETYEDVEMLVHNVTHTFLRQHKISKADYDEWHGESLLAFARAHQSFDRTRGRFSTHLWHYIWHGLADKLCRDVPHWDVPSLSKKTARQIEDCSPPQSPESFDTCSLSWDAKAVVELVLSTFGHVDAKESDPGEVRLALWDLLSVMGWSGRRITESFREIRTALSD